MTVRTSVLGAARLLAGGSVETLFSVPAGRRAILKELIITHYGGDDVYWYANVAAGTSLQIGVVTVPNGLTVTLPRWTVLDEFHSLDVWASSGTYDVWASGTLLAL